MMTDLDAAASSSPDSLHLLQARNSLTPQVLLAIMLYHVCRAQILGVDLTPADQDAEPVFDVWIGSDIRIQDPSLNVCSRAPKETKRLRLRRASCGPSVPFYASCI